VEKQDSKIVEQQETFMFGPTGIVRFREEGSFTVLFNSAKVAVASVAQDSESIMDILRKIRGTEGALNGKSFKEEKTSKRSPPKSKKKSKN
jgi:hypothetical protein